MLYLKKKNIKMKQIIKAFIDFKNLVNMEDNNPAKVLRSTVSPNVFPQPRDTGRFSLTISAGGQLFHPGEQNFLT